MILKLLKRQFEIPLWFPWLIVWLQGVFALYYVMLFIRYRAYPWRSSFFFWAWIGFIFYAVVFIGTIISAIKYKSAKKVIASKEDSPGNKKEDVSN